MAMDEEINFDHLVSSPASLDEEADEPLPEPVQTSKKRMGRPPKAAAEKKPKSRTPKTTTTRKRKQPDDANVESGRGTKRRSSLMVKLKTPKGISEADGLLTPPGSQEDTDSQGGDLVC